MLFALGVEWMRSFAYSLETIFVNYANYGSIFLLRSFRSVHHTVTHLASGQLLRSDEPNTAVVPIIVWRVVCPSNHHWLVDGFAFRQIPSNDPCHTLCEWELRDNSHTTLATVDHDVSDGGVIIVAPSQNGFK